MATLPSSLQKLINEFSKLPGIGPKSAQRLAFYLLKRDEIDLEQLSFAVSNLKQGVMFCSICHNMSEGDPCNVCTDKERNQRLICVVEEPLDVVAIDRAGKFQGVFHVLGGVLNPLEGIGPEKLNIDSLLKRIQREDSPFAKGLSSIQEVIIATNPSLEGETTAMHLSKLLKKAHPTIKISRIAHGLPMGGDLEYADDITLTRAMEGRREY